MLQHHDSKGTCVCQIPHVKRTQALMLQRADFIQRKECTNLNKNQYKGSSVICDHALMCIMCRLVVTLFFNIADETIVISLMNLDYVAKHLSPNRSYSSSNNNNN